MPTDEDATYPQPKRTRIQNLLTMLLLKRLTKLTGKGLTGHPWVERETPKNQRRWERRTSARHLQPPVWEQSLNVVKGGTMMVLQKESLGKDSTMLERGVPWHQWVHPQRGKNCMTGRSSVMTCGSRATGEQLGSGRENQIREMEAEAWKSEGE